MAFEFEKPAAWTFDAGQFIDMTLLKPGETDAEGDTRGFSIASAPFEDTLMIATRMRNTAFKRVLKTLPLGSQVKIEGPFGDLRLHNNVARPAVIVSGGIGITPFRSILMQAVNEKRTHRIFFFYANRRPEDAVFMDDMRTLARESATFTFVPTMTEMDKSHRPWDGERGRIDKQMLTKYLAGITSAIYYVTGPPGMVMGLRTVLKASGVDSDDIRTEEFTGY
ncbi:MAG: FAD-dependent oxidoreductase [Planctomycetota bacterium]|nr:MAG: FAD-dependent oxidoreductase [Planctomycetota bacterium]